MIFFDNINNKIKRWRICESKRGEERRKSKTRVLRLDKIKEICKSNPDRTVENDKRRKVSWCSWLSHHFYVVRVPGSNPGGTIVFMPERDAIL